MSVLDRWTRPFLSKTGKDGTWLTAFGVLNKWDRCMHSMYGRCRYMAISPSFFFRNDGIVHACFFFFLKDPAIAGLLFDHYQRAAGNNKVGLDPRIQRKKKRKKLDWPFWSGH